MTKHTPEQRIIASMKSICLARAAAPELLAHLKALTLAIEEGIPLTVDHAAYIAATDCIAKAEGREL